MKKTILALTFPLIAAFLAPASVATAEPGAIDCTNVAEPLVCNSRLVCHQLDMDDSPMGFANTIRQMIHDGVTRDSAAENLDFALTNLCPEHQPAFERAYDYWMSKGARGTLREAV